MKFKHSLMSDNFTKSDMNEVKKFINHKNITLTQSKKVKEFEKKWSRWLGVKYSVFVNSGSSANYITISALKIINKNKIKNEIIVPTLTWVSDINSVIMNGFKPVFVDINFSNLSIRWSKTEDSKFNRYNLYYSSMWLTLICHHQYNLLLNHYNRQYRKIE